MNVIIHKAISEEVNSRPIAMPFHKMEIKFLVRFFKKNFLPTITSLDDMVRTIRNDKSSEFRHLVNC